MLMASRLLDLELLVQGARRTRPHQAAICGLQSRANNNTRLSTRKCTVSPPDPLELADFASVLQDETTLHSHFDKVSLEATALDH
jgi:hypothetical protein